MATNDPTTDAEGQQNISESGKAPPSRIKDFGAFTAIVNHLLTEDEPFRLDRINEQALFDGEGPLIQEELDASGQDWRMNNNWGGAAAKFEQAQAPYYELDSGVKAELDYSVQDPQRDEWESILAESWTVLHERIWPDYEFEMQNLTRLFVGFGVGIADHEHPVDFRWKSGGLGEHLFPPRMKAKEDAANIHVRIREYRPDELWEWYNFPKAASIGFNKKAIKAAILACNSGASNRSGYMDELSNNVFGESYSSRAVVRLATMRVVEMTPEGKRVSTLIGQVGATDGDFIYKSKKPQMAKRMRDCMTLFTSGIGNSELHSIRGLGHKIFAPSQTENQFINQMFDFARIYMSPMFESDSANAAQQLANMQIGLFNLIPKGLKLVSASAVAPNYQQSVLPLLGFCSQLGQNASGIFQLTQTPGSAEQTREEVVQKTMQNAVLTAAAVNWFQASKKRLANTTRLRLINPDYKKGDPGFEEREEWIKYCTDRGVPKAVVLKLAYITPNRTVGGGSAAVGQILLEKAAAMLKPGLDPAGQRAIDKMVATRLLGSDKAEYFYPRDGIVRSTEAQHFARIENRFLKLGQQFMPEPDDPHFVHAQVHDAALPDIDNLFAQGGFTEPEMLAFLQAWCPHQNAHIQKIQPNNQQAKMIGTFKASLNLANRNLQGLLAKEQKEKNRLQRQALMQQQKEGATAPPSGVTPETQQRILNRQAEVEADLKADAAKAEQQLQFGAAKAQQRLQHAATNATVKQNLKQAAAASDILDNAPTPGQPIPAQP